MADKNFNKQQFLDSISEEITGNDWKSFIIDCYDVDKNKFDLVCSGADLRGLNQEQVDELKYQLNSIIFENKDVFIYVWCSDVILEFDEPYMSVFITFEAKKNSYTLKQCYKYDDKLNKIVEKVWGKYYKFGL